MEIYNIMNKIYRKKKKLFPKNFLKKQKLYFKSHTND